MPTPLKDPCKIKQNWYCRESSKAAIVRPTFSYFVNTSGYQQKLSTLESNYLIGNACEHLLFVEVATNSACSGTFTLHGTGNRTRNNG